MTYSGFHIDDKAFIENFLNGNYLVRFACFIIIGICAADNFGVTYTTGAVSAVVSLALLATLYLMIRGDAKRVFLYHICFNVFVFGLFVSFGVMLGQYSIRSVYYPWDEEYRLYSVYVEDEIKRTSKTVQYKIEIEDEYVRSVMQGSEVGLFDSSDFGSLSGGDADSKGNEYKEKREELEKEELDRYAYVYVSIDTAGMPEIGDMLLMRAKFSMPKNDAVSGFDYECYLRSKGISATAYVKSGDYEIMGREREKWGVREGGLMRQLRYYANISRHYLSGFIQDNEHIEGDNAAILRSILLGDKSALRNEQKAVFSASGASHVLAVSGMHVGIIFGIFMLLFSRYLYRRDNRYRYLLYLLVLVLLWVYAFVTGLSASVVRATIMFSLFILDSLRGEVKFEGKVIAYAALLMILCNPLVVFDIGFQLSFAAVISIMSFVSYLQQRFSFTDNYQSKIIQVFTVPIAAQLGTFPLVLYYFNQFPLYFLLSNLIVVLMAPFIMQVGVVYVILGQVPYVGDFVAVVLNYIIDFFSVSIEFVSVIPFSKLHVWIEWWQVLVLYVLVVYLFFLFRTYSFKRLFIFLSLSLVSVYVFMLTNYYMKEDHAGLYVVRHGEMIVNLVEEGKNVVYTTDSLEASSRMSELWLEHNCVDAKYVCSTRLSDNCFRYRGDSYLVLRRESLRGKYNDSERALEVDVLILERGFYPSEVIFDRVVRPKKEIVLCAWMSEYYLDKYRDIAEQLGVELYVVQEKGTYCRR